MFRFGVFFWFSLASEHYEAVVMVRSCCADAAIQKAMRGLHVTYAHRVVVVPARDVAAEVVRVAVRCFQVSW